jgi:hypothetical protein
VFGHGSSIDELREEAEAQPLEDTKEFLADTFAGFTLMRIIGLRRDAFEWPAHKLSLAGSVIPDPNLPFDHRQ